MKKSGSVIVTFLTILLVLYLFGTQSTAGEKIYQMRGEITAIESVHNTVVIEVPMGKRMFTVAGPLSSEAVLKRGERVVGLTDFVVGDEVTVKWRATEKGHVIEMLKGK